MKKFFGLQVAAGAALLVSACGTPPAADNVAVEADTNLVDANATDVTGTNETLATDNLTADNATLTDNSATNATGE